MLEKEKTMLEVGERKDNVKRWKKEKTMLEVGERKDNVRGGRKKRQC